MNKEISKNTDMLDSSEEFTQADELLAMGSQAFFVADYETAIARGKEALSKDSSNPDIDELIAKAYQAMDKWKEALKYYIKAVSKESDNGNRYVELGIAYAANERLSEALECYAKAEELKCSPDYLGALYNSVGQANYHLGRYSDAAKSFEKALLVIPPDTEILMYKALSHSFCEEFDKAIMTINQLKLLAPSEYTGYSVAYTFFSNSGMFDKAEAELDKADAFISDLPVDYYFDRTALNKAKFNKINEMPNEERPENYQKYLDEALDYLDKGLKNSKPNIEEIINIYIEAADICVQKKEPHKIICHLNAAENPINAFNNGYSIVDIEFIPEKSKPDTSKNIFDNYNLNALNDMAMKRKDAYMESAVPNMNYDDDDNNIWNSGSSINYEKDDENDDDIWNSNINSDSVQESISETVNNKYDMLTTYEAAPKNEKYVIENQPLNYKEEILDKINLLYLSAYSLTDDMKNVKHYARKLTYSKNMEIVYSAKYTEAKAMLKMGEDGIESVYSNLQKYYRRQNILDPSNMYLPTYRLMCYTDMKQYTEAKKYLSTLPKTLRMALVNIFNDAIDNDDSVSSEDKLFVEPGNEEE